MAELQKGKGGTYYTPFPVLGLASDGGQHFLASGGGGAMAAKEVPNVVQAMRFDEATGGLNTVASLSTEKAVVVALAYAEASGLWLATCGTGTKVLEHSVAQNTISEVCEWTTETEGRERDRCQNVARMSPAGGIIATGGTDGVLRLWSMPARSAPTLVRECTKYKEIGDLDFSGGGDLIATCDSTGHCRIWDASTGDEKAAISYPVPGVKGALSCKFVRFLPHTGSTVPLLAIAASAPRGPAYLGIFSADGKKVKEVKSGAQPITGFTLDKSGKLAALNFVSGEQFGKQVWSIPGLKKLKQVKAVHDLPAPAAAFVGDSTFASGAGDRSINLLRFDSRSGGGGGGSCCCILYALTVLMVVLTFFYLLARVGVKGAMLEKAGALDMGSL